MIIYLIIFFLVLLFSFCTSYCKNTDLIICFKSLTFLVLFLPAALRYEIGTDYNSYVSIFNNINLYSHFQIEPLYYLLNQGIRLFTHKAQWIFVFISFFTLIFVFKCCSSRKDIVFIVPCFTLIYYLHSYNIMRQVLSAVICFYSFKQYKEKKKGCFFWAIIACFIHYSSFFYIAYLFLCKIIKNISVKSSYIFLLLIIFLSLGINLFSLLGKLLNGTPYAKYLGTGYIRKTTFSTGIGTMLYCIEALLPFLFVKKDNQHKDLVILQLCFIFSFLISLRIFILVRIRDLFMFSSIPVMLNIRKESKYGSILMLFYLFVLFLLYLAMLIRGTNGVIPYQIISF